MERSNGMPIGGSSSLSPDDTQLLTSGEVARMFGVDPKTVARWADAGKLEALRTLGGHRRYRHDDVQALLVDGRGTDGSSG